MVTDTGSGESDGPILGFQHVRAEIERDLSKVRRQCAMLDDTLSQTLQAQKRLEEEVVYLRRSSSWRLTGPVRFVSGVARFFLGRVKFMVKAATPGGRAERRRMALALARFLPFLPKGLFVEQAPPAPVRQIAYEPNWMNSPELAPIPSAEKWILMVEGRIPMPNHNSGSHKMYHILTILRRMGYMVHFISHNTLENYLEWVIKDRSELLHDEQRLKDLDVEYDFGRDAAISHLQKYGYRYQYAFLFYPSIAHIYTPLIRAFAPDAKVILDCGDLVFLRLQRRAELTRDPAIYDEAERSKIAETFLFNNCDVVVAISDREREIAQKTAPGARIEVLQNIHEIVKYVIPFEERRNLLFIGHYLHPPNVDAVLYFVKDIFPLIQKEIPEIELNIVGSNPTPEVLAVAQPGINVLGFVEDIKPVFDSTRVFIAPLRFGAGVKGKVGQSLSLGLPAVTTDIGAEGMGLVDGETAMIANTAEAFAEATVKLYRDSELWTRIAHNGIEHIDHLMSYDAAWKAIERILGEEHGEADAGA